MKYLNKKEIRNIHSKLKSRFGFDSELDYVFIMNNKNRIFLVNKEIADIETSNLRINSAGLYFAEMLGHDIRLSIEGSQLIGKYSTRNILELDEKQSKEWLSGIDLDYDYEDKGFILIKHKDFIGCGKAVEKKILNFVPKNRRVNS